MATTPIRQKLALLNLFSRRPVRDATRALMTTLGRVNCQLVFRFLKQFNLYAQIKKDPRADLCCHQSSFYVWQKPNFKHLDMNRGGSVQCVDVSLQQVLKGLERRGRSRKYKEITKHSLIQSAGELWRRTSCPS